MGFDVVFDLTNFMSKSADKNWIEDDLKIVISVYLKESW